MGSNRQSEEGKLYQQLSSQILDTNTPSSSAAVIKDVLRNTVPEKDLKRGFVQKRFMYMSLAKNTAPQKKKKFPEKKHYMTRKEKEQLGVLKCPRQGWCYAELAELRAMWYDYMIDLLKNSVGQMQGSTECLNYGRLMSRADLHGSELLVFKSRNPSLIGLRGTCVQDSRDTFGIVTKDDKFKIIPKVSSVFKLQVGDVSVVVFGRYLVTRSADRSVKKIKSYMLPAL